MILKRKMSNLSTSNDYISVLLHDNYKNIIFSFPMRLETTLHTCFSNTHQVNTCTCHFTVLLTILLHQLKVHLMGIMTWKYQVGQITKETSKNKWSNATFHPRDICCTLEQVVHLKNTQPNPGWEHSSTWKTIYISIYCPD